MRTTNIISKLVILFILTAFCHQTYAQAHNVKCASCKYYQKPAGTTTSAKVKIECACEPCQQKNKKEREAKQAEDKRRQELKIAENQRKAKEETERKKREQEKNKPTNVVISAPTNSSSNELSYAESIAKKYERKPKKYKIQNKPVYNEALKDFRDKGLFGVNKDGNPIWQKNTEGNRFFIYRISNTNYFTISDRDRTDPEKLYEDGSHGSGFRSGVNSSSIVDMNGNTKTIDGHQYFESLGQNYDYKEFGGTENTWYAFVIDRNYIVVSDKGSSKVEHKTKIYNSLNDLLEVHNAYASQENGGRQLFATSATVYILDGNLNVLDKIKGYVYFYTGFKNNN